MGDSVEVRICVAVAADGSWYALGCEDAVTGELKGSCIDGLTDEGYSAGYAFRWVTASIPLPSEDEVRGTVTVEEEEK